MKKLLCLLFVLTILGCSSNDDSNQTFRNIYSNTFWRVDGGVITFSNDKLFSLLDDDSNSMSCIYFKEGSYDNVDYDGCTYDNSLLSPYHKRITNNYTCWTLLKNRWFNCKWFLSGCVLLDWL